MFPFSWSFRDWCRAVLMFGVGLLLGMAIWWTSPMFTGKAEPWDAAGRYYVWALFAAGAASTIFLPKAFWLAPIAVYVGQLLFCLYIYEPEGASLWPLGMVVAVFYGVAALAGALGCALLMWLIHVLVSVCRFVLRWRR
ncbi:MAG: hypothetical protein JJ992_02440 [Planctomycetes bacterium]|nr:hypothetical protein [Planctomycetota bacterium]